MFDPPVDAHIDLTASADRISVSAYVTGAPDRPLRWKLETRSRGPGGTSTVSQGGQISAARAEPVGVITVSPDASGAVTLLVLDGETEIARAERAFGPDQRSNP